MHQLYRIDESLGAHFFQEVTGSTRQNRGHDSLFVRVRGQKQHPRSRMRRQDVTAGIDTSAVWQPEVHEYDVRMLLRCALYGVRDAPGLGHDFDYACLPE